VRFIGIDAELLGSLLHVVYHQCRTHISYMTMRRHTTLGVLIAWEESNALIQ